MHWKVSCGVRDSIIENRRRGRKYREIARLCGVSIATVGNVINHGSNFRANDSYARRVNGYRSYREYKRSWDIERKWKEDILWDNLGNDVY